mgnify:CR=1 FL=1
MRSAEEVFCQRDRGYDHLACGGAMLPTSPAAIAYRCIVCGNVATATDGEFYQLKASHTVPQENPRQSPSPA